MNNNPDQCRANQLLKDTSLAVSNCIHKLICLAEHRKKLQKCSEYQVEKTYLSALERFYKESIVLLECFPVVPIEEKEFFLLGIEALNGLIVSIYHQYDEAIQAQEPYLNWLNFEMHLNPQKVYQVSSDLQKYNKGEGKFPKSKSIEYLEKLGVI